MGIRAIYHSFLDVEIMTGERYKFLWDRSTIDRVTGCEEDVKEEVKFSTGSNDPNVANADTLSAVFDRKLHSWPRNPQGIPSFLGQKSTRIYLVICSSSRGKVIEVV